MLSELKNEIDKFITENPRGQHGETALDEKGGFHVCKYRYFVKIDEVGHCILFDTVENFKKEWMVRKNTENVLQ